jgi:hypothetical protein
LRGEGLPTTAVALLDRRKISIFNFMAEQEVIKHTKKIVTVWGDKHSPFWHKLKDFVLEILIIVFAVTISIWFHNWSEHRNEQKVTRTFLLGLRGDIQADIASTRELLEEYKEYELLYTFLGNLDQSKVPNRDSLRLALSIISGNSFLRPHKSRFDGFLSAGKIMSIENDSLTQNILMYYEEVLPHLQSSEGGWISGNNLLNAYLLDNVKDLESDMSKFETLATPKGKYLTRALIPWPQLLERYQAVITEGNKIISSITRMYPVDQ